MVVEDWPIEDLHLGRVGGVATDSEGYVHVFHPAGRRVVYVIAVDLYYFFVFECTRYIKLIEYNNYYY